MGRRLSHRRTRDSKGENPLSRLCFVGIPKMRLISFWAGRTGSTQRSHTGLNSPLFIYHNLSYHTVKDVLQITSLFFFSNFSFVYLKCPTSQLSLQTPILQVLCSCVLTSQQFPFLNLFLKSSFLLAGFFLSIFS